jgi:DNA-binding CsgD family transcriptional regulator
MRRTVRSAIGAAGAVPALGILAVPAAAAQVPAHTAHGHFALLRLQFALRRIARWPPHFTATRPDRTKLSQQLSFPIRYISGCELNERTRLQNSNEWLVSQPALDLSHSSWPVFKLNDLRPAAAKVIYHEDIRRDADLSLYAHQISAAGALVRTTSAWMPDMAISDRRIAIIADPADHAAAKIYTEQPTIVAILSTLFDQVWTAGMPLTAPSETRSLDGTRELLPAERDLLKLLADGATDETAARKLGISLRTARRHVANLMTDLAATSRFQAGAEAARRGWLS